MTSQLTDNMYTDMSSDGIKHGCLYSHRLNVMKMMKYCSNRILSVTFIEGTVTSLEEDAGGCVTGVRYKDKQTGDIKVRSRFFY